MPGLAVVGPSGDASGFSGGTRGDRRLARSVCSVSGPGDGGGGAGGPLRPVVGGFRGDAEGRTGGLGMSITGLTRVVVVGPWVGEEI